MLIAGMNTTNKLNDCIDFAKSAESHWPKSMYMPDGQFVMTYDSGEKAPDNEVLGPVTPRGGSAGIVYQGGKKLAEWGDVDNADMTFSVAKSYLALLAGLESLAGQLLAGHRGGGIQGGSWGEFEVCRGCASVWAWRTACG